MVVASKHAYCFGCAEPGRRPMRLLIPTDVDKLSATIPIAPGEISLTRQGDLAAPLEVYGSARRLE
jgi:hypothetical protein